MADEQLRPRTPEPLREGDKSNFVTLQDACDTGNLVLATAVRKADGKSVALVCATNYEPAGEISLVPLAVMLEGNPYEDFESPMS